MAVGQPRLPRRCREQLLGNGGVLNLTTTWRFGLVLGVLVCLVLVPGRVAEAKWNSNGFKRNIGNFFCSVDQDGNGEIEQGEATKFLRSLDANMASEGAPEVKEGMSELLASAHFDFNFSYGGNTISAEEMLDHLSNMMTANLVVDWVTHGLELPQYAEAFRQNAINGMDFPALIEKDGQALVEDLGIKSTLHRTKITLALVRQIFGIGTVPGPIRSLRCTSSCDGGIYLLWEAPTNRGVPPLHKFLIERWSKTLSTWIHVADTREVAFLDTNAVKPGKNYTYRVQTWGGHGPSDWVTLDGCRADSSASSSSAPNAEEPIPKQMASQVSTSSEAQLLLPGDSKTFQEGNSGMWTWVNSGLIVFLALCSRHTFFFDVSLAAWVLLKNQLRQSLRQGLDSPYLCVRTLARSITLACESWCYIQHKVWTLARFGVEPTVASRRAALKSLSEPCMKCPFESEDPNGKSIESQNLRSFSADNFVEASSLGTSLSLGDTRGSSPSSSEREIEMEDELDKAVMFPPPTPPQEVELSPAPSKRSKNRCNYEGCKVRFDRWHSLQDWWMKLNKHYCRECQSVYCVKHTRISPHGPRGQCGLDSSCYCYNCFASLPSESKRRLEEMNKLRVGPSVSSDSSSSTTSLSSSKQKFGSFSSNSIAGAGLPPSLSDPGEPFVFDNGILDFRDAVGAKAVGVSKAASDSGMPDDSFDRLMFENGNIAASKSGHRRQRSFA